MAFKQKIDIYGLSAITGLEVASYTENKTAQTVEAQGEDGFVIANQVFGEVNSPACEYVVKGRNINLGTISLGGIHVADGKSYCLTNVSITTGAGQTPTVNASGSQVEDNATAACTATLTGVSFSGLHHAQTFGAFELSGTGAHLTNSSFDAACTVNPVTKDGVIIAHDITDGRLTVNGTIQVSDVSYPTPVLSVASGWVVTAPMTETNPDSAYPTYTFTLTKYLTAVHPE